MCSIQCWILSIWEALGCIFCIFGLIHALSTRGRSLSKFWAIECIWRVVRWFRAISGLCVSPVWSVVVTGLTGQSAGSVHMLRTGRICGVDRSDRSELTWCSCSICFRQVVCMNSSRGSCIGCGGEGPKRRTREGVSEWESIKILLEELDLWPKVTSKDLYTNLPRSRSHNGPTDPRNKLEQA
jgi:hypothetical protein